MSNYPDPFDITHDAHRIEYTPSPPKWVPAADYSTSRPVDGIRMMLRLLPCGTFDALRFDYGIPEGAAVEYIELADCNGRVVKRGPAPKSGETWQFAYALPNRSWTAQYTLIVRGSLPEDTEADVRIVVEQRKVGE